MLTTPSNNNSWANRPDGSSFSVYLSILHQANLAFILVGEDGKVAEASAKAAALFGYSQETILEKRFAELFAMPDFAFDLKGKIESSIDGIAINYSGEKFDVDLSVALLETADGKLLSFIISETKSNVADINNTIAITSQLEQTQRASLFDMHPSAIVVLDLQGVITNTNGACVNCFGVDKSVLVGKKLIGFLCPIDTAAIKHELEEAKKGETRYIETLLVHEEACFREVKITLSPIVTKQMVVGMHGILEDISSIKLAEKKLGRTIEILEETNKIAKVGGYEYDLALDKLTWTNTNYEIHDMPIYYLPTLAECVGFFKQGEHQEYLKLQQRLAIKEGKSFDIELILITASGAEKWVRVTGNSEFNNGKCVRLYGIIQDIHETKLVQTALIEERGLLRTLIDNLPVAVFVKDKFGKKLIANKLDVQYMGLQKEEEAIGKTDLEIFKHSKNHKGYHQDISVLTTGESIIDKLEILKDAKGEPFETLVSKFPLNEQNGKRIGIIGICRDISNQKKIEQRLNLVDFAFKKASLSIFLLNPDATFYDVNDAAHNLLGYTKGELMKLKVEDINPEYTVEGWPLHWAELREKGSMQFASLEKHKSGKLIDVEIKANLIKFGDLELNCAFVTDITERRKAEVALQKSNERYEYALMAASDAVWEADLQKDQLFLSQNFELLFGHEVSGYEKAGDNTWSKNVHPDDLQGVLQKDKDVIQGNGIKWQNEYRLRKANGEYAIVLDRGLAVKDESGKVVKLVGAIQDITIKKQEEERLKLLETVITHTIDAVTIVDTTPNEFTNLPILFVNKAFTKMTGYTLQDIQNKGFKLLQGALTSRKELDKMRYSVDNWQPCEIEVINYKKTGEPFWINISTMPVANETGWFTHWVSIQRDITERKNAEAAFLKVSVLNKSILNSANLSIISADMNGMIISFNACAERWLGYSAEEMVMQHSPTIIHDADELQAKALQLTEELGRPIEPNFEVFEAKARLGDKSENEWTYIRKDGTRFPVMLSVVALINEKQEVTGFVGVAKDITVEKKMKVALQHSYDELELTLSELSQQKFAIDQHSIVATTDVKGTITYANDNFCRISKYSREELIGQNHRMIKSGYHPASFFEEMYRCIAKGMVWHGEICNKAKDGKLYWVNTTVVPYLDNKTRKPIRYISIRSDITERKKAEAEKEQLLHELTQNNKELKQFSYITTHNLRAPLTNLIAIAKLIDVNKINDAITIRLIDGFKKSTYNLNETLNDLINVLIIKENTQLETTHIGFETLFEKVTTSIQSIIDNAGAVFIVDFSKANEVQFNSAYLESIFLNLITNAIKYADPAKAPVITIKTDITVENQVQLIFADNGMGMNMDKVRNKIFGLYQRFHNNADSKGIGLYLIYSQITALGGKIEVDSKINEGTIFTITFK